MKKIKILAISGSLRSNAANTNILKNIGKITGEGIDFEIFEGLEKFPHFNPGFDEDNVHVADFRQKIQNADGVIICTPEYAFGVPGVLKNALDWIVSTGELNDKPVAAISASPLNGGGDKALASLLLTLTALGTVKNEKSSLSIPNIKHKLGTDGEVIDRSLNQSLALVLENLFALINLKLK
ncbi:NAD(P)H-dependent oxidoreductase [Dyadobacter sp. LHD-138]|uniref:NADPH-dependent FMN reductase n=1 Tax=Dyadobacter sp. LHD-138 TaxID=3071413 RepID=UPI0027DF1DED|nr:NAD(P)H-dependent oxidoreductase [Dyadobacter sp. LHD-138]MDQ6478232.1 NAD(P)H-dependent oxidoreductase [Dyadobacter sp. LHD-138]